MLIERIWKPWFILNPMQVLRRIALLLNPPPPGYMPLRTSWGGELFVDPSKTIGHAIAATGVYELAVSELLIRLVSPGATVIDAGANVGYMTILAATAAGRDGRVVAFEPNPKLFPVLQQNVDQFAKQVQVTTVELSQAALGEAIGSAQLHLGAGFSENDGIASLIPTDETSSTSTVPLTTLDSAMGDLHVDVMKVDVEGYELQLFHGAEVALRTHRIKHIIFEEHPESDGRAVKHLAAAGYEIFALSTSFWGPVVVPIGATLPKNRFEAPNFIATVAPDELRKAAAARGWRALRRISFQRS